MPSPQEQDDSLAAALSKQISVLHDAHSCSICHGLLSAPVSLPCSHIFCSECARRHLCNKSACPHPTCRKPATYTNLNPLRTYDVSLEPLRRSAEKVEVLKLNAESRLVFLSRKSSTRAQFLERLRAHDIPTHGGTDAIANRYNDFVIRWNANLDAGVPKSKKAIIAAVMAAETEAKKVSKRPRTTSSFFKKLASQESTGDDDIPTQGDDFETLMKKTKARMEKKRKLGAGVQSTEKRVRLNTTGQSQKAELGSQATTVNDAENRLDSISRPLTKGKNLKRADVREESNDIGDVSRDGVSSQFDNNSPLVPNRIEPTGLAVHSNVCSVEVVSQDVNRNFESSLEQADPRIRPESQKVNAWMPQAPLWSQTTPEKQAVPVDESHATSSVEHEATVIRSSTLNKVLPSTWDGQGASGAKSTKTAEQRTKSVLENVNAPSVIAKRPREPGPPRTPLAYGRNMSKEPSETMERPADHRSSQLETENVNHTPRDVPRDIANPSSTEVTPTRAQLDRAERNRLAALERRKEFYERKDLSQMRQPDL